MSEPTAVLYTRLPEGLVEWIRDQAVEAGLSMAQVTRAMLEHCRAERLTVPALQVRKRWTCNQCQEGRRGQCRDPRMCASSQVRDR